ncbi:MAG: leucine-rich repeat protein [Bacteroidales bacterium]|nr:leucine-rich repeat protein [Bacteroidales bacterium]
MGDYTFYGCTNLKRVILPELKYLGGTYTKKESTYDYRYNMSANGGAGSVFQECKSLEEIEIPNVEYIPRFCFKQCYKLKEINIPKAKYIGYGAFSMVNYTIGSEPQLVKVVAPLVDSIGHHAFQQCINLSELYLGATPPAVVGYKGNNYCSGGEPISKTTHGNGPDGLGSDTSYLCAAVRLTWAGVPMPVLIIPSAADGTPLTGQALRDAQAAYVADSTDDKSCHGYDGFWFGGAVGSGLKDLTVSVNGGAPITMARLKDVLDASGVAYNAITSIEVVSGSFIYLDWNHMRDSRANFTSLQEFIIRPPVSIPNIENAPNSNGRMFFPTTLTTFIGDSVIEVGACAFYGLTNLSHVELPYAEQIGQYAFHGCTQLKKIKLPRVQRLVASAFAYARLDSIWLPPVAPVAVTKNYNTGALTKLSSPTGGNNPFYQIPTPRYLRFVNPSTGAELLPPSDQYKNAKATYKNHTNYYNPSDKTWLGWTFFEEFTLTVDATNGKVNGADPLTIGELDSLEVVRLGKYAFTPNAGYALHPSLRGITSADVTIGADTSFTMPAKNVKVSVEFEKLYSIDPDPSTPMLDTITDPAGNTIYPVDSLFAGDSVRIGDIVNPAQPGYEVDTVRILYCDSEPCTWKPLTAPYVTGSPATLNDTIIVPGGNIKIEVDFKPKYTVTVKYGPNGTLPDAIYRLAPDSTLSIPVSPATGYHVKSITATPNTIVVDKDNPKVTMPSTPVNIVVNVEYEKNTYTLTYTAGVGGIIEGTTPQTVEHGANGTPVTAKPTDANAYRFKQWSDGNTENPRTDTTVTADLSVMAEFVQLYPLTYTVTNGTGPAVAYYAEGDPVTVTGHKPNEGYKIKSIKAYKAGDPSTAVELTYATDTTLKNKMPAYAVTVEVVYEQVYKVNMAPYTNGTATADKSSELFEGDEVTLTIAPATGYGFKGLSVYYGGDPANAVPTNPAAPITTGSNTYKLTMPAGDVTVVPVFAPIYTVTLSVTDGTATADKTSGLFAGDPVQLTLTPNAGYKLRSLDIYHSGDPTQKVAPTAGYAFDMPASHVQVDVVFEKFYNIAPDPTNPQDTVVDGQGNKICPVDSLFAGDKISIQDIIKPAPGYTIDDVTIYYKDGNTWKEMVEPMLSTYLTNVPPSINDSLIMPPYDLKFEVTFKPAFTIEVYYHEAAMSAIGAKWQTTGSPTEAVKIPIKPVVGYHLKKGAGGIAAHETGNDTNDLTGQVNLADSTITMPDPGLNIEAHVYFEIDTIKLRYTADANGALIGTAEQAVTYGGNGEAVLATPTAEGYRFKRWSDGRTDNPRTDMDVTTPVDVEAQFERVYTVTIASTANGSVSASRTSELFAGDSVLLSFNPDACYHRSGFVTAFDASNNPVPVQGDTLIIMPASDVTVEATFSLNEHMISAMVLNIDGEGNNTGNPIKGGTINGETAPIDIRMTCSSEVTFTFEPIANHRFAGWYVGGVLVTTANPYTFTVTTDLPIILAHVVEPAVIGAPATVCGEYVHPRTGDVITTSGEHEWILPNPVQDTIERLTLTINPVYNLDIDAEFCGSYIWAGDTYTAPGDYTKTLVSKFGCDSIVTLHLNAAPVLSHEFSAAACGSYIWNGTTYDASGDYTQTLTTASGCDSVVTLHLSIVSEFNEEQSLTACGPYAFNDIDGNPITLSASGDYVGKFTTAGGCDSTVTLHFTLIDKYEEEVSITACAYPFKDAAGNDITVSATGDYTGKFTTVSGCDSIVTLHFTEGSAYAESIDTTFCLSEYSWTKLDGTVVKLTADGAYTDDTYKTASGCDSTVTLNLTFGVPITVTNTTDLTVFEPYTWFGDTYTHSGKHTKTFTSADGCTITEEVLNLTMLDAVPVDSTVNVCANNLPVKWYGDELYTAGDHVKMLPQVGQPPIRATLTLNVHPVYSGIDASASFCGADYTWEGNTYTASGDYTKTLVSKFGCDSTVTLHLTKVDGYRDTLKLSTCEDSYAWAKPDGTTETYTASGDYECTVASTSGCDSTVVLRLLLNDNLAPVYNEVSETICAGSFTWNGNVYTTSGDYTETIGTGCRDSIVTLHLTIGQTPAPAVLDTTIRRSQAPFVWEGDQLTDGGEYTHTSTTAAGCVATSVLRLTVLEPITVDETAHICEGQSYSWLGNVLNKTGVHEATVYNPNDRDTVKTLTLTVHPIYSGIDANATFCGADYTWEGSTYLTEGDYTKTLVSKFGCDSTVTLHLAKVPGYNETVVLSICEPTYDFADADGNAITLTASGQYTGKFTAVGGCDSIVNLDIELGVVTPIAHDETVNACDNYIWNGRTYTVSGTYDTTFVGSCGRDSVVTLHLNISTPPTTVYEAATIREGYPYLWEGETYTSAGIYTKITHLPTGCDATKVLYLNVIETVYDTIRTSICANELPYPWYGDELNRTGEHSKRISNPAGDTLAYIDLTVLPAHNIDIDAAFCGSYTWEGTAYTEAGTYTKSFTSQLGCDSTVTLHLTKVDGFNEAIAVSTCASDYTWNGTLYTASGDYTQTFTAMGGCDSVVTMSLLLGDVADPVYNEVWESICGDSYTWEGTTYTEGGDYIQTIRAVGDCRDSIVTLHLTMGLPSTTTIDTVLCEGRSFAWDGDVYTTSGTHIKELKGQAGCDSIVTLNLTISSHEHYWLTVLADDSYSWNGKIYTESGAYADTLKNVYGCDSVVTLYLTVVHQTTLGLGDGATLRESLTLYPNPTTGIFNIEAPMATEVQVHSISGQLLHRQPLLPEGSTRVDISRMPAGVYVVRAGSMAAKLVKL